MYQICIIIVHCLLMCNNVYADLPSSTLPPLHSSTDTNEADTNAPQIFPTNTTMMHYNGQNISVINYTNFPFNTFCWPNISKTFWRSMLHAEKNDSRRKNKKLKNRYEEITQNVTDNIMQIIYAINELSNLLQNENLLEFGKDVKEDSFFKSIIVPVLLIVILLLLTYIAFQHRKLQFARYKDAQILIEDELIDP